MALRSDVGGCVPGRGPLYRRGAILDHVGREQVGCWWLSAITLHSVIMPPPAAASNLNRSLGSFLRAGGRTQPKTTSSTQDTARGKSTYSVGWGVRRWEVSGAPFHPFPRLLH